MLSKRQLSDYVLANTHLSWPTGVRPLGMPWSWLLPRVGPLPQEPGGPAQRPSLLKTRLKAGLLLVGAFGPRYQISLAPWMDSSL